MLIDLRQLFELVGERSDVKCSLDFGEYELFGEKPFITPVVVDGCIRNDAGVVTLGYTVSVTLGLVCDRCLKRFNRDYSEHFTHVLVSHLENDADEYILVESMHLDLDELVYSDIVLSMPMKVLCSESCKGLCPVCGHDLNMSSCDCVEKKSDSPFDVLNELLT